MKVDRVFEFTIYLIQNWNFLGENKREIERASEKVKESKETYFAFPRGADINPQQLLAHQLAKFSKKKNKRRQNWTKYEILPSGKLNH